MLLPKSWVVWIDVNLQRGSNLEMLKEILERTFPKLNANQTIADRLNQSSTLSKVIFPALKFDMFFIKNFLSETECRDIIKLCDPYFHSSTLSANSTGTRIYEDNKFRSSSTCHYHDLPVNERKLWDKIETKICDMIKLSPSSAEHLQLQRYRRGNQFKPHCDGFTHLPKDKYFSLGNRTWTIMVYLNTVEDGGETHFEHLNLKIKPETGMAVVWYNLLPNGNVNYDTLHEGCPVLKGEKYIITKWFRQKSF